MIKFIKWFFQVLSLSEEQVRYRRTIEELRSLSDYELRDIGISRSEIYEVAAAEFKKAAML
jgi:uncharacterized protein YjiS (DUF1127 family)|tara:strand:+ start:771 stop:953 length:183 start_codon:yes stop_codon:yes gene_type:complete